MCLATETLTNKQTLQPTQALCTSLGEKKVRPFAIKMKKRNASTLTNGGLYFCVKLRSSLVKDDLSGLMLKRLQIKISPTGLTLPY